MTVATVHDFFEKISRHLHASGAESDGHHLAQLAEKLQPYSGMSWDVFLAQLGKVKKPPKTQEEKDAEKRAKAELAAKAKEEKKAAADAAKAAEKQRKADEKAELKKQADEKKAAEKQRKADAAAKAKEDAKAAKAQAKIEAEKQKQDDLAQQARLAADHLKRFVDSMIGGTRNKEDVDAALAPLADFNKDQLMIVAKALDSDGGLTDKSTKAAIKKQLESNIRRLWKTSHNVLH
jgi:flagellar biosynthesis GTPase FlhF